MGKPPPRREHFAEAETLFDRLAFREYLVHALHGLAAATAAEGRAEEAARLLGRAADLIAAGGEPAVVFAADLAPHAEAEARAQIGDEAFGAAFATRGPNNCRRRRLVDGECSSDLYVGGNDDLVNSLRIAYEASVPKRSR